MANYDTQKKQLMNEVRSVLNEVEDLYSSSIDNGSEQSKELKERFMEKLNQTKGKLREVESSVVDTARATVERTDELVREKPYYAVGIAALTGLVAGLLIGHCRR
ncbi:DUF883 family protein [Neisseriaceae bacterium ESL0693]|nr:DUF883 family protein [Neisseriaceae bacterium ESL0693]